MYSDIVIFCAIFKDRDGVEKIVFYFWNEKYEEMLYEMTSPVLFIFAMYLSLLDLRYHF